MPSQYTPRIVQIWQGYFEDGVLPPLQRRFACRGGHPIALPRGGAFVNTSTGAAWRKGGVGHSLAHVNALSFCSQAVQLVPCPH